MHKSILDETSSTKSHGASVKAYEDFMDKVIDEICAEMKRQGMTRTMLADTLNVPERKVDTFLDGKKMSMYIMAHILAALGMEPNFTHHEQEE